MLSPSRVSATSPIVGLPPQVVNHLPQVSLSGNIILQEEQSNKIVQKEMTSCPSFQELVENIHRLARHPQLMGLEKIALISSQLNEALQQSPCLILEDYLVRFVQLRQMLEKVTAIPDAQRLYTVLEEHLYSTQKAAETLYKSSDTPVQDSLWPLYKRILDLPTIEPDFFGTAVAALHEKLPYAPQQNPLATELQTLLPWLKPPSHYFWSEESPFTEAIEALNKTKQMAFTVLNRLEKAPEGYIKVFCAPMKTIFDSYRDFIEKFTKASENKKLEMCLPKAQLSGPGFGFFLLDQITARTLVGRDAQGTLCEKKLLGTHHVHHEAGVFYKPNSEKINEYIRPELEFAIYALYQLLGQPGTAPTILAKISHLFFEGHNSPHERTLQAGYGIEGIALQDLLDIDNVIPFLSSSLGAEDVRNVLQWLLEPNWQQEFLTNQPELSSEHLSSLSLEESVEHLMNAYTVFFNSQPPQKRCVEFVDGAPHMKEWFRTHIAKHSTVFLVGTLAILQRYPDLTTSAGKSLVIKRNSYTQLIELLLSIRKIQQLFPKFTPERLLEELSQLMNHFDSADFSRHVIATLLTSPTDHRADNLMVTLKRNEQGGISSFSLVGIDNDLAFGPEGSVRTMLYLLKPMTRTIDPLVARQLVKSTPEGLVIDWLVALEEQNQSYEQWQKRGVLLQDTPGDEEKPSLQIPLKMSQKLVPNLYAKTKRLVQALQAGTATHWELLNSVQPALKKVYQDALKYDSNPTMAYGEVERLFRQEQLYPPPIEDNESSPYSPAMAALDFINGIELHSLPIQHQVSLIGKVLHTFPSAAQSLSLPGDAADADSRRDFFLMAVEQGRHALVARLLEEEKKSRLGEQTERLSLIEMRKPEGQTPLLLACRKLDLEMIRLLLHYGADPQASDLSGRGALSLCLVHFSTNPGRAATAIRFLAEESTVFLNTTDNDRCWSPLHCLVAIADAAPEEAEPLIAYLIGKGANPDLVDDKGRSTLDHAIEYGQERFVEQLIRLGAGRTLNVEAACIFFASRPHLKDIFMLLQSHSLLLRWHLALKALKEQGSSKSRAYLEGAQLGRVALLSGLTKKLLTPEGDIKRPEGAYGRRNVQKITIPWKHDLFFKQYPEMPGIEYAVNTLFELLIGHGTSFTELAKLTPAQGKSYPVLISQGIQGENLQDILSNPVKAKLLDQLDPLAFFELFLASLLVNFEDAKPDNFILQQLPEGTYRLVGIDNDHAFVSPLVKEGGSTVQVKCILYCLDLMKQPIHPIARERFLALVPERLLHTWLNRLATQNQRYCALFTEKERHQLFKETKNSPGIVISIPFRQRAIIDIYQKFQRLQTALKESPNISGMELLRLVIPPLGIRYEEAFNTNDTPWKRFLSLTETQYSIAIAGRLQTMVNSQQMLKSMSIPEKSTWKTAAEVGPNLALEELEKIHREIQASGEHLAGIRNALQEGDLSLFEQLELNTSKEKVINGIPGAFEALNFKTMPANRQKKVLAAILAGNYRSLRFLGCSALDGAALNQLLRNSPQLLSLELSNCSGVNQDMLTQLSQATYLTHLHISDLSQIAEISIPHATLRHLEIARCPRLKQLTVSHTLKSLTVDTCWGLFSIEARIYQSSFLRGARLTKKAPKDFVLQSLHLKACPQLQPWWGMFQGWLTIAPKHDIQLQNVPLNPSQKHRGVVVDAILQRPEARQMLVSFPDFYRESDENLANLIEHYISNQLNFADLWPVGELITDRWLQLFAQECPDHSSIALPRCNITDSGLQVLQGCPNLSEITLESCNLITIAGIHRLAQNCSKLRSIKLLHCVRLYNDNVARLKPLHPNIHFEVEAAEFSVYSIGGEDELSLDIDSRYRLSVS